MKKRIALQPRKEPRQGRSRQMREDILTASIRVLRREGPLRFTTLRVAEAAGISVGSLYQYFPNKQSLVFAMHSRTVELAWITVQGILDEKRTSARTKIRRIAEMFFLAESQEVREMGVALQDSEVFFQEQPEHHRLQGLVFDRFTRFVRESLPRNTPAPRVTFGAHLLVTVLESVGKTIASRGLSPRELKQWAHACADMLGDHLGVP
jgi:AcrR family transcriptional regulator